VSQHTIRTYPESGFYPLKKDPMWSNRAVQAVAQKADGVTEMALQELLQDRSFITEVLQALPRCCVCKTQWISRLAVLPVDLDEEQELFGLCDDCPIPSGVIHVRILPHARALRELTLRARVWEQ